MSQTRIICKGCGLPMVYCKCGKDLIDRIKKLARYDIDLIHDINGYNNIERDKEGNYLSRDAVIACIKKYFKENNHG